MEQHHREILIEVARETGNDIPIVKKRAAGDPKSLRGIPVAAVKGGLGGVAAGTQPEAALMRKEAELERRGR